MINTTNRYGYKLESLNGSLVFKVHTYTHAIKMKKQYTDALHKPIWIMPIKKSEFMQGIWREPLHLTIYK